MNNHFAIALALAAASAVAQAPARARNYPDHAPYYRKFT